MGIISTNVKFNKNSLKANFSLNKPNQASLALGTPKFSFDNRRFFRTKKSYPIPNLPLINEMVEVVPSPRLHDLSKTAVIGVQHMLETTLNLFTGMQQLGVKPQNMYFTGKCYSSSPEVETAIVKQKIHLMPTTTPKIIGQYHKHCQDIMEKMWNFCLEDIKRKKIERLIILDEGGRCLEAMPENVSFEYEVAGIEQTRAGLYSNIMDNHLFPVVDVASSAAKKRLEPALIAEAVLSRVVKTLKNLNLKQDAVCGVVGNGAIGSGVVKYLLSKGYKVVTYDENEDAFQKIYSRNLFRVGKIEDVIVNAQYIFGCTGKDITQGINFLDIAKKDKVFISCSSEDKEFLSLLRRIAHNGALIDPMSDVSCVSNSGSKILILKGGFPINFDRTPSSVPANDIELTRGLLLGAFLQAVDVAKKPIGDGITINQFSHQQLNPYVQKFIVNNWINRQPTDRYPNELIGCFDDIEWIKKNSGGEYYPNEYLEEIFSKNQQQDIILPASTLRLAVQ